MLNFANSDRRYTGFLSEPKYFCIWPYLFNKNKISKFLLNKGSLENEVIKNFIRKNLKKLNIRKNLSI